MSPVRDLKVMHYVYFLKNEEGGWYTGYTGNLWKRLSEHREGKSTWTKHRGPWELVYYEACLDEQDARSRERYLKTGMGKRYLKNRLKRSLSLTG